MNSDKEQDNPPQNTKDISPSQNNAKDDSSNQNDTKVKRKRDTTNRRNNIKWKRKRIMYIQEINRLKQEKQDAFDTKPMKSALPDNWLDAAFDKSAHKSFLHLRFPLPWIEKSFDMAHGLKPNRYNDDDDADRDVNTRLWHVTDVPQRPSFLDFLLKCASFKLKQTEHHGDIDRGGHFENVGICAKTQCLSDRIQVSDHDSSSGGSSSANGEDSSYCSSRSSSSSSSSDDDTTDDNSAAAAANTLKQLQKQHKKNLPSTKTVPKWVGNQQDKEMHQTECQQMHLALDETAAVALGILTEEVMVSSLLSLARRHVALCRNTTYNGGSRSSSLSMFVSTDTDRIGVKCISKMTLPAHEAIVDMIQDECYTTTPSQDTNLQTCCIPSSQPPSVTSSQTSCHAFLPTVEELLLHHSNKETVTEMQKQRLKLDYRKKWRRRNNYSRDFLQDNHDLFRLFVGDYNVKKKDKSSMLDEIQTELERIITGGSELSVSSHTGEYPIPMIFTSFKHDDPKEEM